LKKEKKHRRMEKLKILFYLLQALLAHIRSTITLLNSDTTRCTDNRKTQNVFGTNKMVNACRVTAKGFNVFDYDIRATNNGFTHEVASGVTTRKATSVSAIHGSTNIIGDHEDGLFNLYIGDFSITTTTFPKSFVSSSNYTFDLNYIEGTVLIIAVSFVSPFNIEIHITT
jgi:hypothetical protein